MGNQLTFKQENMTTHNKGANKSTRDQGNKESDAYQTMAGYVFQSRCRKQQNESGVLNVICNDEQLESKHKDIEIIIA